MNGRILQSAFVVWLAAALTGPGVGLACDPNHDWVAVDSVSRRVLGYQAAAGLVDCLMAKVESAGTPVRPGDTIAIVKLEDDFARTGSLVGGVDRVAPRTPRQREELLAGFDEMLTHALETTYRARVVPLRHVRILARQVGAQGETAFDEALRRELRDNWKAQYLLAGTLTEYAQALRLYRDVKPENRGLFLAQTYAVGGGRLSLQRIDGTYVAADDFRGHGASQFLFFGTGDQPSPVTSLIQVQAGRPAVGSANWQRYPDRDHFQAQSPVGPGTPSGR